LFSVVPVLAIAALLVTVVSVTGWYWWRQANQWSARNSLSLWTSLMSEHVPNLLEGTDDEIRSTFATMDNAITTMMGAGKKSGPADRLQWLPGQELEAAEREFFEDVLVLSGLASERRSQLRADQIPLIEQWQALCNHAIAGHGLAGALTQQPLNNMTKDLHFSALEERPDLPGNTQTTEGERILHARFLAQQGMPVRSIEALSGITPRRSIKTLYWITVGDAQRKLGHSEAAVLAYGLAINEAPRSAIGYSRRSQLLSEMKKWEDAERDCTSLINLNPKSSYRLAERARLRESMGKIDKAIADMDEAIAIEPRFNRYYFFRSRLGRQRNDSQKAQEDYRLGLSMTPSTTEDWISRALAHLPKYPEKSMADLKRAEQMAPNRFEVLQNQAHILSEYLHDEEAAIMALSLILDNDPDNVWARVDRCVLLARNGKKQEVLSEVDRIIGSGKAILPDTYYQIACAYSLLVVQYPEFQERSLHYLSKAIIAGYGHDLLGTDKDLDPIRSSPHFSALMDVTNLSKKATVNN
jgi:tetratricopeptide (TPR) repeat protein